MRREKAATDTGIARTRLGPLLAAVALVLAANVLPADTVTRTDGTVLKGRIIQESNLWVVLEIRRETAKLTLSIPRKLIRSIKRGPDEPPATTRPAATKPVGPGYYPLPIKGEIGVEVTAEVLTQALNDARSRKPKFLVLHFDSPGGSLEEMRKLTGVLKEFKKELRFVALVRRARGVAAVLALACPEIYLTPDGKIGPAAPAHLVPGAEAPKPDPRIRSMILAELRTAAGLGGHSALVARGMGDSDLELALATEAGKPVVKEGKTPKPLKAKGELLALSGQAAVDCGLARGLAKDVPSLHQALGLKHWHKLAGGGWYLMIQRGRQARQRLEMAKRKQLRDAYMKKIAPELERIDAALKQVKEKGRAAEAEKKRLQRSYDKDLAEVQADYRQDVKEAGKLEESNPGLAAERRRNAKRRRNREREEIKRHYGPRARKIQKTIRDLLREMKSLQAERRKLLAQAPK